MKKDKYILFGINETIEFLYSYTADLEKKVNNLTNEINHIKYLISEDRMEN